MHAPATLVTSLPTALGPSRKPATVPALELTHWSASNGAPVPVLPDLPAAEAALGAESAPCSVMSPVLPGSVGSVRPQGESNTGYSLPAGVGMAVIGAPVAEFAGCPVAGSSRGEKDRPRGVPFARRGDSCMPYAGYGDSSLASGQRSSARSSVQSWMGSYSAASTDAGLGPAAAGSTSSYRRCTSRRWFRRARWRVMRTSPPVALALA
jgi:hypothetical protein